METLRSSRVFGASKIRYAVFKETAVTRQMNSSTQYSHIYNQSLWTHISGYIGHKNLR